MRRLDRILAFDPAEAWLPPRRTDLIRLPALPWVRPPVWNTTEPVALGLSSHGSVVFASEVALLRLVAADRSISGVLAAQSALVHQSRRAVVEKFLDDASLGQFLMMVDGDVVVAPDIARGLVTAALALQLDVAGQPYGTLDGAGEAALFDPVTGVVDVEPPSPGTACLVDAVGFGAVLLRRSLLATMVKTLPGRDGLFAPEPSRPDEGEDFAFCRKARAFDARIASVNVCPTFHMKPVPLALR